MPAVFQRLSDAMRVIMVRKTPVDSLLGMLDDFLGIVYRKQRVEEEEWLNAVSNKSVFRDGCKGAKDVLPIKQKRQPYGKRHCG